MNLLHRFLARFALIVASLLYVCVSVAADGAARGTIESLDQDNGYITISGKRLGYSDDITQVFLEDKQIGSQKLDAGMVVNYTVDSNGIIVRIDLLGPAEKLQMLDRH